MPSLSRLLCLDKGKTYILAWEPVERHEADDHVGTKQETERTLTHYSSVIYKSFHICLI